VERPYPRRLDTLYHAGQGMASLESPPPHAAAAVISLVPFPGDTGGIGGGYDASGCAPRGPGGPSPVQEPALGLRLSPRLRGVVLTRAARCRRCGIDAHNAQGRLAGGLSRPGEGDDRRSQDRRLSHVIARSLLGRALPLTEVQ